jgi:hypothetical protein
MSSVETLPPIDADGVRLEVGDAVLVLAAPIDLGSSPPETKAAFSDAVGRVFPIAGFNEYGLVELQLIPPGFPGRESIWIEPALVRKVGRALVRRYELSKLKGLKRSKTALRSRTRRSIDS